MFCPVNRFQAVEIGCMFKYDEGLSTLQIAKFIHSHQGEDKHFVSIDNDPTHIAAAKQMISSYEQEILFLVDFQCGHSLTLLPKILHEMNAVDFVFLDGGAHPEVCLREFELALERLGPNGMIIMDDIQELTPSEAYPYPRIFGKGTLTLPYLVIAQYLGIRSQLEGEDKQAYLQMQGLSNSLLPSNQGIHHIAQTMGMRTFIILTDNQHKMLVVSTPPVLDILRLKLESGLKEDNNRSLNRDIEIHVTPAQKMKELLETKTYSQNLPGANEERGLAEKKPGSLSEFEEDDQKFNKFSKLCQIVKMQINDRDISDCVDKYAEKLSEGRIWLDTIFETNQLDENKLALWKEINQIRNQLGLPYLFVAKLGPARTIDGVDGLLSKGDLDALKYCAMNSSGICVNIGVYHGLSTYYIAKTNLHLQVYGIDAYLGMSAQLDYINQDHINIAKNNLSSLQNAHLIVGLSSDVAKGWKDEIGFLLIDGDHTVKGATSDFTDWSPFVEKYGFIAVHDCYGKISPGFRAYRENEGGGHGPDIVCRMMEDSPDYEFIMVSGCTEIWRKIG